MEKRLISAIILSVAILIAFQLLFVKNKPQQPVPAQETAGSSAPASTPPAVTKENTETPTPPAVPEAAPAKEDEPVSPPVEEVVEGPPAVRQDVTVDSDLYRAILDNKGAILKSFILKKFKGDALGPVEMIPQTTPKELGSFLDIVLPDHPELAQRINKLTFHVDRDQQTGAAGKIDRVRFSYQSSNLKVEKAISFLLDKEYLIRFSCSVTYQGKKLNPRIQLGPGLTQHALAPTERTVMAPHLVYYNGKSAETLLGEKVNDEKDGQQTVTGSFPWAGVQTKFFAAIAIPDHPFSQLTLVNHVWNYKDPKTPEAEARPVYLVSLLFPENTDSSVTLFVGPKSYQILSSIRGDLTATIDYGWFSFLVKPLYFGLLFVQKFIGNWGWSIVVLTFLITLAVFPLRYMQMKSMKEMQKIQPQMKAIQAKYKGQKSAEARQKMNAEMMQLYKDAGVNPMGGCLPLLIQFPFLIAFYRMIELSIEFWHQPFIFWIHDLSAKDPYYITPILMGFTMIVQMQQTPTAPGQDSKMQKRMMYFMPIMFTFLFLNFSSGLVIYFLFSNVFSWGLQKIVEIIIPSLSTRSRATAQKAKGSAKKRNQ